MTQSRGYGVEFDIGEPQWAGRGYIVSIRNAFKGPMANIEYASSDEAEAAAALLRSALEPALSVMVCPQPR